VARRADSDEHYILDLCDEALGVVGRRYDERKRTEIPDHRLRLVVIEKSAFTVKSKRIARDRVRDLTVVREHLGLG
jgi:hypothetical protein